MQAQCAFIFEEPCATTIDYAEIDEGASWPEGAELRARYRTYGSDEWGVEYFTSHAEYETWKDGWVRWIKRSRRGFEIQLHRLQWGQLTLLATVDC